MHPNPAFRKSPAAQSLEFARERGFGTLAVNGPGGPLLSHIPFLLSDDGQQVNLHLVRSNPIVALLATPQPAMIAVSGPDSYISPDWYGVPDQVPTWNYVAIHLRGTLQLAPPEALHAMLDRLTAAFETRLDPKAPWTSTKMSDGLMDRMMRAIVPCTMTLTLTKVDLTWKLGQNKPDGVRTAAAGQVAAFGIGNDTSTLAALMLGGGIDRPPGQSLCRSLMAQQ